ncbi:NADP oxidoreductase [Paludibaculum fermentans]|uniref:NADH-quinone oxidoreductase subunit B family protein n=1 Tax=Paludibaculum fermentans TaxID=1473598 RepID=UPI003EBBBC37
MSKAKVATVWLDGCSGCHMSLLDIDEVLIDVLHKADIVYGPLVDAQEFPEGVDVTLAEGAVSSQHDYKLIQQIRKRTKILIALGDCAVTGNVPSMRNTIPTKRLLERAYVEGADIHQRAPSDGVPALLRHAVPVQEIVKVDLHLPGCPPKPALIAFALTELLAGRKPDLTNPSVAGLVKFG